MKNIKYIAAAFLVSGMLSAQSINVDAMPKPSATPTINIAQPKTFKLRNGLTVLVVENHKLPRVTVSLSMDRPPLYEGNIAGVSDIFADQIGAGTKNISKDDFRKKVDFLGAFLSFYDSGASANTLSKYFPEVMRLMADAIVNPKFSLEEIEKSKERAIENLKTQEKSADEISDRVATALAYGKNTARGEFSTEKSLKKIQLKDIQDYYTKYYAPNNAYLAIVGDVKFEQVKKLVEKQFKNWKKSSATVPPLQPAQNVASTEVNFIDLPSAVQSVIKVGNLSTLQMKDPNYFAGVIGNYVLGSGGESRLFLNLREKNGFTYGAYSRLSTSKYSPRFIAEASVRNEVTDKAVVEFLNEIRNAENISQEELKNAKAKLKGDFIMSLEKPATLAKFAYNQLYYNLPADFYTNYLKSIDKVTRNEVAQAVRANILPNQSRIVIVGKASEVADSVEKLGYPVKYFDAYANPTQKPEAKKISQDITVQSIGEKYIQAIGGRENIAKIISLTTKATGKVQGIDLELISTQAKSGKSIVEMKMMGNTMSKVVFDGKDGYIMAQGQKMPLPEEVKSEMLKMSKEVFPELSFNENYELKGVEKINGEEAFAIGLGTKTAYYSVESGLKIAEVVTQKAQGKVLTIPTYFSDYKQVGAIKLPFRMKSTMQGIDVDFVVTSYDIDQAKDVDFK